MMGGLTDKFWTVAEQVPGLAVLVSLVYFFLRHLRIESETGRKHNEEIIEKSNKVIENNTFALMGHNDAIRDLKVQISNQTTVTELSDRVIAELRKARGSSDDGPEAG